MSAIDVKKNKELEKLKERKDEAIGPLTTKKKKHFSKLRNMINKKKQGKL